MKTRIGTGLAAVSLAVFAAPPAFAQSEPSTHAASDAPASRFGENDAFAFTVENVLGITSESLSQSQNGQTATQSQDGKGFFPGIFGPSIGLHVIEANHLTFGTNLILWHARSFGSDGDSSHLTVFGLLPRIGYAGTFATTAAFGYWLRGGPSVFVAHSGGSTSYYLDLSFEAYAVVHPVEHVGILLGPHVNIALTGHDDADGGITEKYSSIDLLAGLMGDL